MTDYRYTGQRSEGEVGLYFYVSRFYDPALGRFIQPDSIIPDPGSSKGFDRYAYVNNNPVNFNDPSGHDAIGTYLLITVSGLLGWRPDVRGAMTATAFKMLSPDNDDIIVGAAMAVQSEWMAPWDIRGFPGTSAGSSGLGWAQVSDQQMEDYGLAGQDQWDPNVAYTAMEARIGLVQDACQGCSAADRLIASALAQNGPGFTASSMKDALGYKKADGSINWNDFFKANYDYPSDTLARIRQFFTGKQFDTQFMILLYTKDLRLLHQLGWELPEGISEEDLEYMMRVANGGE